MLPLEPVPEVHSPGVRVLAAQESGPAPWAPELEGPGNTHTRTRAHTHTHARVSSQYPSLLHARAWRCTGQEGPSSLEGIWPGGRQSGRHLWARSWCDAAGGRRPDALA